MDEYVVTTFVANDESETLVQIERLHRAGLLAWPTRPRFPATLCHGNSSAGIDTQHLDDLWPPVSLNNMYIEKGTGLHSVHPSLRQYVPMEESVTKAI